MTIFAPKTMIIVSAEEFDRHARNNLSGKIYRKKSIIPGVIFSIRRKQVAINYCQELMSKYQSMKCLLVEDGFFIQVWYDRASRPILNHNPNQKNRPTIGLGTNRDSQSLLESKYLPIDRAFVLRCQTVLAEAIGPIARIIIKRAIFQNNKSNRQQFVVNLIREIKNIKQCEDLERQLNQLLSN